MPVTLPSDLTKLPPREKAAAAAYVLSRTDWPLPPPPTVRDIVENGRSAISGAWTKVEARDPHAFTGLFGEVGGTASGIVASAAGKLLSERGRWVAVLLGVQLGALPPALAGAALDKALGLLRRSRS